MRAVGKTKRLHQCRMSYLQPGGATVWDNHRYDPTQITVFLNVYFFCDLIVQFSSMHFVDDSVVYKHHAE